MFIVLRVRVEMVKNIPLRSNDLEELFNAHIASYGYRTNEIKKEAEDGCEETYRTSLRRQRDKILYTGGFRRLQDKTQVISASVSGDHRTRLTHTLEVEQIAVSIANALRLNMDLVSAIALGHDVGHTPFGHAAERKLNKLLKENGEFHHPIQSVRYLWEKYGSKIVPEIYEGILLHDSDMFKIKKSVAQIQLKYLKGQYESFCSWVKINEWLNSFPSTLEAQVVIWSDKIAYITHDLEDFLRCSAYINLKKNNKDIEGDLCDILSKLLNKEITSLDEYKPRDLIRNIISDLINSSAKNINAIPGFSQKIVREETEKRRESWHSDGRNKEYLDSLLINFSDEYRANYYRLRGFLDDYYIFSPEVQRNDAKAEVIVEWLFNKLTNNYKLMPLNLRDEVDQAIICELFEDEDLKSIYEKLDQRQNTVLHFEKKVEKEYPVEFEKYKSLRYKIISRKVASYIATMSDTYAENMYRNLIGSSVDFNL